jgi:hypothetical protein
VGTICVRCSTNILELADSESNRTLTIQSAKTLW